MDKFAINWQIFAQVELQLKFAFRIRLLVQETVLNWKKRSIIFGYCRQCTSNQMQYRTCDLKLSSK